MFLFHKTSALTEPRPDLSPESMAAALSKNCFLKTQNRRHSEYYLWKRAINYSTRNAVSSSCTNTVGNQLHQYKPFSYFTLPIFRKVKEVEFSARSRLSSHFSSKASVPPPKFKLVGWYLSMLKTRPIATKSVTAALIYTAADVSSQTIVGEQYDMIRTLRMAGYGMLILGPSLHYWYNFMSRVFPKRDLLSTFKKMASGQLLYGPAMTAIFFSVNAALQGENDSEIVARLKRDLLPTMINGIMYWPVCDFITFRFIPVQLQPLVVNSFSYLWTIYMTYMASLEKVGAT